MATSYSICLVNNFEKKQRHYAATQITFQDTEEPPESYYNLDNQDFMETEIDNQLVTISSYNAYQDVKQNKHGKVFGRPFKWYLEPHEFKMYYIPGLQLMIFNCGKDTVNAFLAQMKEDRDSGFNCNKLEIDFRAVQPLLPMISGAWFAELQKKKQYLKSAGLYGPQVDKSEEFKAAAEAGVISSLIFPYKFRGQEILLGITRNGAVVFYNRLKNPITKQHDLISEINVTLELHRKFL